LRDERRAFSGRRPIIARNPFRAHTTMKATLAGGHGCWPLIGELTGVCLRGGEVLWRRSTGRDSSCDSSCDLVCVQLCAPPLWISLSMIQFEMALIRIKHSNRAARNLFTHAVHAQATPAGLEIGIGTSLESISRTRPSSTSSPSLIIN
jgi:hypothetical protein